MAAAVGSPTAATYQVLRTRQRAMLASRFRTPSHQRFSDRTTMAATNGPEPRDIPTTGIFASERLCLSRLSLG
jgi:hypothetical protein